MMTEDLSSIDSSAEEENEETGEESSKRKVPRAICPKCNKSQHLSLFQNGICGPCSHDRKAYRYRLYPTDEQARYLRRCMSASRMIYNELVREYNRHVDYKRIHYVWPQKKLGKETSKGLYEYVTTLRDECGYTWFGDIPGNMLLHASKHFGSALSALYKKNSKRPRFKKKTSKQAVQFQNAKVVGSFLVFPTPDHIKVDKHVRMKMHRRPRGRPKTATISCVGGRWFASIVYEWPKKEPRHKKPGTEIGVDMNASNFLATSEGTIYKKIDLQRLINLRRRRQRQVARKKKFSANWYKQQKQIARIDARIADMRKDVLEKVSHELTSNYETIYAENLHVKKMTKSARGSKKKPGKNVKAKSGLNRVILNHAWGMFLTKLQSKALRYGGRIVLVSPEYTSQTCSSCGYVDKNNRKTQASFICLACGLHSNADVNAAKNILSRGRTLRGPTDGKSVAACGGSSENGYVYSNSQSC